MTAPATGAEVREGRLAGPDPVTTLIARWRAGGTSFVVVDERGRHTAALAAGRLDLAHAGILDAHWIDATLHRAGYVLLDARNVPRGERSHALSRALTAVQRLRARTGQPEWVVVEDAPDVLHRPDIPPHALRLADGGYALVARDGAVLPASAVGSGFEVHISRPGLELSLVPPVPNRAVPGPRRM